MRIGKDAEILVLSKYVHPSEHIGSRWPNPESNHRLKGVVLRQDLKQIWRSDQLSIVFHCDEIKDLEGNPIEVYAVKRWCNVSKEGPPHLFYNVDVAAEEEPSQTQQQSMPDEAMQVIARTINGGVLDDLGLRDLGGLVDIDDDNNPAPENVPVDGNCSGDVIFDNWGHSDVCKHKRIDAPNRKAKLKIFPADVAPTMEQMFRLFVPMQWLEEVLLVQTNQNLKKGYNNQQSISVAWSLVFDGNISVRE